MKLKIKDFLDPSNVLIEGRAFDKASLLKELCTRAAKDVSLPVGAVLSGILRREELGSTGIGHGIALPHANIAGLSKPYGTFVRLLQPIDFDAIDAAPVDIICLLLLPAAPSQSDLNALACVTRSLRSPEGQAELRKASDAQTIYRVMSARD